MSNEPQSTNTYALENLIFKGPGIGLPDEDDASEEAALVRLVFEVSRDTLDRVQNNEKWNAARTTKHSSWVESAWERIRSLDIEDHKKADLAKMLSETERIEHVYLCNLKNDLPAL